MTAPEARVVSIGAAAKAITAPWKPVDLALANEAIVRLARFEGSFPWHAHDEDELFLCWSGEFTIELDGRPGVELAAGDLFVVPAGVRHHPVAERGPAYGLLLERPETLQYGNPHRASGP